MSIIICEPQCIGFEHATFNAALLMTAHFAFPAEELLFFCEKSHWQEIQKVLCLTQTHIDNLTWQEVNIPSPYIKGVRRIPLEKNMLQDIITDKSTFAQAILLCSATEITVFTLKRLLRKEHLSCPIRVVLHGVLRSLIEPRWRKPWRWGFSLRQALRTPHPAHLKYIVLSESIRSHAILADVRLEKDVVVMDMPRLMAPIVAQKHTIDAVNFGYFGSTAKGFSSFYALAELVKMENPRTKFSLIGFLNGRDLQRAYDEKIVQYLTRKPLSMDEYMSRGASVNYAVWLADPTHYSLTASASFLDAIEFGKPLIYLANPYIDYYANKLGDIGYRCENMAEMQSVITKIAANFPAARYDQQCEMIYKARTLFTPTAIARTLHDILE